jgi:hypothetical protein
MSNHKFKKGDLVAINPEVGELALPQPNFGIFLEYELHGWGCLVWWATASGIHPEFEANLILIAKS